MAERPRDSDRYYDMLGQRGHFRHCHTSVDNLLCCTVDSGVQASVCQGGYLAANDLDCTKELAIGLVVNSTSNIPAPNWQGDNEVPDCYRFLILGIYIRSPPQRPPHLAFIHEVLPSSLKLHLAWHQRFHNLPRRGPIAPALALPRTALRCTT